MNITLAKIKSRLENRSQIFRQKIFLTLDKCCRLGNRVLGGNLLKFRRILEKIVSVFIEKFKLARKC